MFRVQSIIPVVNEDVKECWSQYAPQGSTLMEWSLAPSNCTSDLLHPFKPDCCQYTSLPTHLILTATVYYVDVTGDCAESLAQDQRSAVLTELVISLLKAMRLPSKIFPFPLKWSDYWLLTTPNHLILIRMASTIMFSHTSPGTEVSCSAYRSPGPAPCSSWK